MSRSAWSLAVLLFAGWPARAHRQHQQRGQRVPLRTSSRGGSRETSAPGRQAPRSEACARGPARR
eukprot:1175362-Alexandrium_andersonii.AAC.1